MLQRSVCLNPTVASKTFFDPNDIRRAAKNGKLEPVHSYARFLLQILSQHLHVQEVNTTGAESVPWWTFEVLGQGEGTEMGCSWEGFFLNNDRTKVHLISQTKQTKYISASHKVILNLFDTNFSHLFLFIPFFFKSNQYLK